MVLLTNSLEGGTNGTTLTQGSGGNTGGASGSFFDSVTVGTGVTLAFDNTHAAHGTLACKIASGATSASSWVQWDTSAGSLTTVWFRFYMYWTAFPATKIKLMQWLNVSTQCGAVSVDTNGFIEHFIGTSTTPSLTGSVAVGLNQWTRLEGFLVASATVGQIETKLFNTADSATPDETLTDAATQNTNTVITKHRMGLTVAQTNIGPFWLDDFGLSDTGYLGPAVTSGAPVLVTQPGRTWLRQFHHAQTLLSAPPAVTAPQAGPPVYLLGHPVQARQLPQRGGTVTGHKGLFAQTGPQVTPPVKPVRAQPAVPFLTGRVYFRAGVLGVLGPPVRQPRGPVAPASRGLPPGGRVSRHTGAYGNLGPPVVVPRNPVQAKQLPHRGGSANLRTGVLGVTGPPLRQPRGPVRITPSLPPRGRAAGRAGTFVSTAIVTGPPVYPLDHPVQARVPLGRGGKITTRTGIFSGTGPAVPSPSHPVQAHALALRGGRITSHPGVFGGTGPAVNPVRPLVAPKGRGLPPRGRTWSRSGVFAQSGPPVTPADKPVQAKTPISRTAGRMQSHAGAPVVAAPQTGPPIYPLGRPVQARALPARGGRVVRAVGVYAGTGAPAIPQRQPVSAARRPLPARGRAQSRTGIRSNSGPVLTPPRNPVRIRPQLPPRGQTRSRSGVFTSVILVPPGTAKAGQYPLAHSLGGQGSAAASRAGQQALGSSAAPGPGAATAPVAREGQMPLPHVTGG